MQIPAGYLADRFSIRIVYGLAVGLWSVAGAAAAFAIGPRMLAWTRAALGVGESFNWPCALRVTANMLPPKDRALANGVFSSGSAVGALVAPLIITPLADHFGWRVAFFVVGALGAVWLVIWWVATRKPGALERDEASGVPPQGDQVDSSLLEQLKAAISHPGFWLLMIVSATMNPCWYFCADWIPKYMHDQRGFSFLAAGLVATPIFLGADLGNLGGGALVKILAGRGWSLRQARGIAVAIGAGLILPAVAAGYVENAYLCIGLLAMAAVGITSVLVNYLACLQDISFASVGLIAGILGAIANIVGATINPMIGRYVDATGNYHLIFVLLGIFPLIGLIALLGFDAVVAKRERKHALQELSSPQDPEIDR